MPVFVRCGARASVLGRGDRAARRWRGAPAPTLPHSRLRSTGGSFIAPGGTTARRLTASSRRLLGGRRPGGTTARGWRGRPAACSGWALPGGTGAGYLAGRPPARCGWVPPGARLARSWAGSSLGCPRALPPQRRRFTAAPPRSPHPAAAPPRSPHPAAAPPRSSASLRPSPHSPLLTPAPSRHGAVGGEAGGGREGAPGRRAENGAGAERMRGRRTVRECGGAGRGGPPCAKRQTSPPGFVHIRLMTGAPSGAIALWRDQRDRSRGLWGLRFAPGVCG